MMPDQAIPGDVVSCRVSIVIACRDVGRYIDEALHSARNQSVRPFEILVVDDCSTDDTRARIEAHAAEDARLMMLDGPGRGAGAARNVALDRARGDWIVILDGDDFMHPRRIEVLLAEAARTGTDIVADNLLVFHDPPEGVAPLPLLTAPAWTSARLVDLATYVRANALCSREPQLGYLKPLIRRAVLSGTAGRYDEAMRIGEDYDLIARLLAAGRTFAYLPAPLYSYRRHRGSTSFRMSVADIDALIVAAERFDGSLPTTAVSVREACRYRRRSLERARHFTLSLEKLKARHWAATAAALIARPAAIPLMGSAVRATIRRRLTLIWRRLRGGTWHEHPPRLRPT